MKNLFRTSLLAGLVSACAVAGPDQVTVQTPITAPAPTNVTVVETYDNLGRVEGDPHALPETAESQIARPETFFSDAVQYGQETNSYALLIWWKGSLVLEHYYPGFDSNVLAEPASMHKSVMALAVAKAIEEGYISSVDATIGTYISEWEDDPRGDITISQLLTMSSGLAPLSYIGGDDAPARKFMAGELDARKTILDLQLEEPLTPHFHYANTVSQLAMLVLESATGQPYSDYLSEAVWKPIGASDAFVYNFEDGQFPRGYASLLARPLDWMRLGLLVKDNGMFGGKQVIASELVKELKSPSELNADYGWQIWRGETWVRDRFYNDEKAGFSVLASEPYLLDDLIYFDGFGGQRVISSESEDLVIVRLGDTRTDWDDAKLPNLVISALKRSDDVSGE
jgi:CubicO group peptidase (beta-lactamase class C family)